MPSASPMLLGLQRELSCPLVSVLPSVAQQHVFMLQHTCADWCCAHVEEEYVPSLEARLHAAAEHHHHLQHRMTVTGTRCIANMSSAVYCI